MSSYGKFGLEATVKRSQGNITPTNNKKSSGGSLQIQVNSINLNPEIGFDKIGVIVGTKISPNNIPGITVYTAYPASSNVKNFPIVNEIVTIYSSIDPITNQPKYIYYEPVSMFGSVAPNNSAKPKTFQNQTPPSQQLNYTQVNAGAVNIADPEFNQSSNVTDNNGFVEKGNIHPLLPFEGDIVYEGRWGNSLRFGSTTKTSGSYQNNWSSFGKKGDPIFILRNGQNPNSSDFGAEPITENISKDLSSIYLTSYQQLNTFKVASELYQSYKTPPIFPSQYKNPQVILNSDRIVINAKSDSILLSAQQSIGISTNGSVNVDATSHYISSNDIKLGSKNATQPVLLGNDTVEILKQLAGAIKDLASILQVQRDYPSGVLATSYNSIAGNVLTQINSANGILAQLNNDSLKSKTTKVQ
jgi:hypothetical protein